MCREFFINKNFTQSKRCIYDLHSAFLKIILSDRKLNLIKNLLLSNWINRMSHIKKE